MYLFINSRKLFDFAFNLCANTHETYRLRSQMEIDDEEVKDELDNVVARVCEGKLMCLVIKTRNYDK